MSNSPHPTPPSAASILPDWLRRLATFDLRSLALFRIGLGLLILGDLAIRADDLKAHYTDWGVLPLEFLGDNPRFSLHILNGSPGYQAGLFVIAGLFAGALIFGFHTRLATAVSWFLLVSLHARNPVIQQGGDVLLRLLLFWGMFLPLGARWSMDSARKPSQANDNHTGNTVCSMAVLVFLFQLGFVYWFNAINKMHPAWTSEGTAAYYALSIDQMVTPFGEQLLQYPTLLKVLSISTWWFEALGPCLVFVPFFIGTIRTAAVVAFMLFHISLGLTMELGPFPYVCVVAWLAVLPSGFWKWMPFASRRAIQQTTPPEREPPQFSGLIPGVVAAVLLGYVFLWNLRTVDPEKYSRLLPARLNYVGILLGIDQQWNMFSPFPLRDDGWYVIVGRLKDGTTVDLFRNGQPVSWEKPDRVALLYPNERWRKYLMNLYFVKFSPHRRLFLAYLARRWNEEHPSEAAVTSLDMYFMLELTLPDYETSPIQQHHMLRYEVEEPGPQSGDL